MSAQVLAFPAKPPVKMFEQAPTIKGEFTPLEQYVAQLNFESAEKEQRARIAMAKLVDQTKWAKLRLAEQVELAVV